jgi:hypothetical protein
MVSGSVSRKDKKAVEVFKYPQLFINLPDDWLKMQFHGSGRAGFDTDAASNALLFMKVNLAGSHVQFEDSHRTDSNAGAAMSATFLVTDDILAEGFNNHACFPQVGNAFIIVFLFTF